MVGVEAVRASALPGTSGSSIAMRRTPGSVYKIETFLTPLSTVARETRHLDHSFIENGNNITQAFVDYARPLVGTLPTVGSFDEWK